VIFGHSKNPTVPQREDRESATELTVVQENLEDSGLGSSIGSPSNSSVTNQVSNETPPSPTPAPQRPRRRGLMHFLRRFR
jgi:hypothetical protein